MVELEFRLKKRKDEEEKDPGSEEAIAYTVRHDILSLNNKINRQTKGQ
jgi:hypothetical protein